MVLLLEFIKSKMVVVPTKVSTLSWNFKVFFVKRGNNLTTCLIIFVYRIKNSVSKISKT